MLLLADFLSSASRPDLQVQLQAAPPLPPQLQHCLISGPPRSGKTSILFHLAYRMACQQRSVLLLCLRSAPWLCAGLGGPGAAAAPCRGHDAPVMLL